VVSGHSALNAAPNGFPSPITPAEEKELDHFMSGLIKPNNHETEFQQAVLEVPTSMMPWYLQEDDFRRA